MISRNDLHNRRAPYWAAALFLLGITGVATIWIDLGPSWGAYVLDITGPAWNYILFRGLFTEFKSNRWTRFFTPTTTVLIFIVVCFGIEGAQYLDLYESTYDPWDLLAYLSLLLPLYSIDLFFYSTSRNNQVKTGTAQDVY